PHRWVAVSRTGRVPGRPPPGARRIIAPARDTPTAFSGAAMSLDFDVIVIGSGAGGGTAAYGCALAGKRVLLVERGGRPATGPGVHDERATLIEKRPYDDRTVRINRVPRRPLAGGRLRGAARPFR